MRTPRIVVLGGGYAGVLAALRAKARAGARAEVTLVSEGDALIERIRLHELAVRERNVRHALSDLVGGAGVDVARARVTRLDPSARSLETSEGTIGYDALIVAAGSITAVPPVAGHLCGANGAQPRQATSRVVSAEKPNVRTRGRAG